MVVWIAVLGGVDPRGNGVDQGLRGFVDIVDIRVEQKKNPCA
jgi:hypothetical protein